MFTQTLTRRILDSGLVAALTTPHGIDRYTELLTPTWVGDTPRARVVDVARRTPRSVTLLLAPNEACTALRNFRAGQHVTVSVEIDGRRRTRCYSPANAEGEHLVELTVGLHEGGLVSEHLYRRARPGMVVGLDAVGGDFTLPASRPERMLFVAGGSGITPVVSMLRTLSAEGHRGELAVIHYTRNHAEAAYRDQLAALTGVRVLHGYTREPHGADLVGRFDAGHLAAAMPHPDAVYVCGPPALTEAVRRHRDDIVTESFVPPTLSASPTGGRVTFLGSRIEVVDDGRPLLDQAESAGLRPESGCRMGVCHRCTCRKSGGTVRNLITGALSGSEPEDIQICVSAPVGDVEIAL